MAGKESKKNALKLFLKAGIPLFLLFILLSVSSYYIFFRHVCYSADPTLLCKAARNEEGMLQIEIISRIDEKLTLHSVQSHACPGGAWKGTPYMHRTPYLDNISEIYGKENTPIPLYGNGGYFIDISCAKEVFFDRIDMDYQPDNQPERSRTSFYVIFDYYKWPSSFWNCCD